MGRGCDAIQSELICAGLETLVQEKKLKPPLVSVIVAVHNYERFVGDALKSVAEQSYRNFECIVIDDASTDSSKEVVENQLKKFNDPRFKLISSKNNLGQMGAIAKAVEEANGYFVSVLDADDVWMPDFIKAHISAHLNESRTSGFSYCDGYVVDADFNLLQATWSFAKTSNRLASSGVTRSQELIGTGFKPQKNIDETTGVVEYHEPTNMWHFSPMSGCMWRAGLLRELFPKNHADHKISADYQLALMAASLTGSLSISKAQFCYRLHGGNNFSKLPLAGGNSSTGTWNSMQTEKYNLIILETYMHRYSRLCDLFNHWNARLAVQRIARRSPRIEKMFADRFPEFYREVFQVPRWMPVNFAVRGKHLWWKFKQRRRRNR